MDKKVAVIGLDGMPWHVLNKIFDYGAMSTLNKITKRSLRGILKSTIPPMTPPAWTSIASGVNPGKHGIFDFITYQKSRETRLTTALDVRYPRINEMVALKGLRSVCINQPFTYPPPKVRNAMVMSDWIGPKVTCYPKLLCKYVEKYPAYTPRSEFKSKSEFLYHTYDEMAERVETVNTMMEELDWDLFWVVYSESDHLLHGCYDYVLRGEKRALKILDELDKTIRKACELSDLTLVISDHGFFEYHVTIEVNSLLYKLGLAAKTPEKVFKDFTDFREGQHGTRHINLPSHLYKILSTPFFKRHIKRIYTLLTGREIGTRFPYADPEISKAFMCSSSSFGIFVDQEDFVQFILEKFGELDVFSRVFRREEIYSGPYVDKAPHVIFLPNFDKGYIVGTTRITPKTTSKGTIYNHHPDGILIMYGDEMNPKWIGQAQAVDIVPTILNYLGLPTPVHTDGKYIQNLPLEGKKLKRYNYLNHWLLTKKVSSVKTKLSRI